MQDDYLIEMANDVSSFFVAARDPAAAATEVMGHIRRFWDPRMRRQIIECWRKGEAGFSDVARAAVALLAADQKPAG
ncbi:MAG TPA: formate dehydrogenase subunit delta [Steroidobacteraceae bacterium]|nr:formate dehydrogenase subunit delta [Steroidobacteraceae bacterium]